LSLSRPEAVGPDAEGFVLAGGRSSRMGRDKALIEVAGRPLIQHSLQILRGAGLEPRIAGAQTDLSGFASVVPDGPEDSGLGPLAGICAALSACARRFAVMLPVDLPLIPASLIEYLLYHARVAEAAVTVASVAGFVQTLPAVVDRAALAPLADTLQSGDRNCLKAFRAAGGDLAGGFHVLAVELLVQTGHVRHPLAMHPGQWFLNVNTSEDLRLLNGLTAGSSLDLK
jgi:molybdopterin-guanine dinucleotide biosynthesis protein A